MGVSLHLVHIVQFSGESLQACVSVCLSLCTATFSAISIGFTYYDGLVKTRSLLWLKNFLKCQKINHMCHNNIITYHGSTIQIKLRNPELKEGVEFSILDKSILFQSFSFQYADPMEIQADGH